MLIRTRKDETLAPAFARVWQLWVFVLFIVLFALLPLLPKPLWIDRSALYLAFDDNKRGGMAYIANHALQDPEDIDILFLGGSSIGAGINPLIVKDALRPLLGREPVMSVIPHPFGVPDFDYIVFLDVLRKRNVKLLIWNIGRSEYTPDSVKLVYYTRDFYLHGAALRQLPADQQGNIYFINTMNGLRTLLSPLKDHLPPAVINRCPDRAINYGHCRHKQEFPDLDSTMPSPPQLSLDQLLHWRNTKDPKLIEEGEYPVYDQIFIDALFNVAAEKGIKVAFIYIPSKEFSAEGPEVLGPDGIILPNRFGGDRPNTEGHGTVKPEGITVPVLKPNQPGYDAVIIGATASDLFPGRTLPEMEQQFYKDGMMAHLHYAAAKYYTRAILPAIIEVFKHTLEGKPVQP